MSDKSMVGRIPSTRAVRERIAKNVRETRILRQLLRVAERAERERQNLLEGRSRRESEVG